MKKLVVLLIVLFLSGFFGGPAFAAEVSSKDAGKGKWTDSIGNLSAKEIFLLVREKKREQEIMAIDQYVGFYDSLNYGFQGYVGREHTYNLPF